MLGLLNRVAGNEQTGRRVTGKEVRGRQGLGHGAPQAKGPDWVSPTRRETCGGL